MMVRLKMWMISPDYRRSASDIDTIIAHLASKVVALRQNRYNSKVVLGEPALVKYGLERLFEGQ
jgi:hypothetical protein